MLKVKEALLGALRAALSEVAPGSAVEAAFELPRQATHGDLAITSAMQLAKPLKKNPRELAQALVQALQQQPDVQRWVYSLEIAGPGFINLKLAAAAKQSVVSEVLEAGAAFGQQPANGKRVMVEFVSANPTGPLHLGHGRQAALGDSMCRLLQTQGWSVHREFYYNDAGVQIETLAASVQARMRGLKPGDAAWPEAAYNGEYIADIAADFLAKKTVQADDREFSASGGIDDLDGIRQFAVAYLRHEQDLDLQAFGVKFDHYYLESGLYASGRVEDAVRRLVAAGKTYEEGGALWLRTTDYGDDKDRVMRKSDGSFTYFLPDVAYHLHKWERGFVKVINLQGTDHHGTVVRVRAGLQAAGMGVPQGYPDYVLHKMVTVMRGAEEVKISKRAGGYVTLRDLIDWTSRDAVRFFLASRKADTEFVFDIELALKQNDENPVFYVQYAHARICSVLAQYVAQGGDLASLPQAELALLTAPTESALMLELARYPEMLTRAAAEHAPHDVTFYLRDVAAALHSWYAAERFLADDAALARARMALLSATREVLRCALGVLGVSSPGVDEPRGGSAGAMTVTRNFQAGGFVLGLIVGLLVGLALALGVALYVTKVPVPFINKVPQRTAEQDAAEAERNKNWDPNAPLSGKAAGARPPPAAASAPATAAAVPRPPSVPPTLPPPLPKSADAKASKDRDPAAILAGAAPAAPGASAAKAAKPGADPFIYFVQAGAFQRSEDAEARRAQIGLLGIESKIIEREQSGRTVYRVRLGPFDKQPDADTTKERLLGQGVEAVLVRVERSTQ